MRKSHLCRQCICACLLAIIIIVAFNTIITFNLNLIPNKAKQTENEEEVEILRQIPEMTPVCDKHKRNLGVRRSVLSVNCMKLMEGDDGEISKAKSYMTKIPVNFTSDTAFVDLVKDCDSYLKRKNYKNFRLSKEELEFPIAYSILMFKDVEQTEKLLRAIYRPHNVYCIHVDKSASSAVHRAVKGISKCLPNVFVASKLEDVIYEGFSRLQADLNCMSDLMKHKVKWKYFINLPSQQYPLKTNYEIIKILKTFNGANDIEGITVPGRMFQSRYKTTFVQKDKKLYSTGKKKGKPPHNITVVKGSAYGTFSRQFVDYILNDKKSKDLLDWNRDIRSPDEYYWATLHFSKVLKVPGGYTGVPDKKPWLTVYAAWGGVHACHGKFVRGVCVFGVGDLVELASKKHLFANKFYLDYQYLTLQCLEEWLFNKTYSSLPFETFYYKQLPFIRKP